MFNEYAWDLYAKSGGNKTAEMFNELLTGNLTNDLITQITELHSFFFTGKITLAHEAKQLEDVIAYLKNLSVEELNEQEPTHTYEDDSVIDADDAFCGFYLNLNAGCQYNDKETFEEFSAGIAFYSTLLAISYPAFFIPYFFRLNFNFLTRISEDFEIELPEIPAKKDYKGRLFYYKSVCDALKSFQHSHNLSDSELCAFLYDFAPKYIGGTESYIVDNLPEAKSAFFIGGSRDDAFLTDDSNAITIWQCNPETRVGDMIVMYIRTPVSAICSIWRSRSIGFNDPFFYYYRCTFIGNPVQIKPISLDTLRNDETLSKMWIVRKNMQGINGVELKPSEYNRIIDLAGVDLPHLEYEIPGNDVAFNREKDVENKLVKPLLKQLKYGEQDYVQQLYLEIGNHNHALIPDFVILPRKVQGNQTAFAVLEAKLTIQNQKQLNDASVQARSYSKLLGAKYQLIASKEGIWLFSSTDDFAEVQFSANWTELKEADKFYQLYKAIGNH